MDIVVIGENIRKLRENAGFTQASIASFLDVDQSLISKIEKGERGITLTMFEKLSYLFGVDIDQLEHPDFSASKLSFAFRGKDFSTEEMRAITEINKIALNSEFMSRLLMQGNNK